MTPDLTPGACAGDYYTGRGFLIQSEDFSENIWNILKIFLSLQRERKQFLPLK
jgi:hypothetical protein